ncbi:MAG: glycerophosphodiester phosphodiesterase [Hyphomicrobiaceae bacterium]|nr:MAG: glycerophosphodiester phosphodiesterase [Hyphomicrobiaceae bacterium]
MSAAARQVVGLICALLTGVIVMAHGETHAFDLQGHRGARGLLPENTLPAFRRALEIGVTTLETDLAMTKDGVLVLSHDRMLNPDLVRGPDGEWLKAPGPAIRSLALAEVRRFDVGRINPASKYATQFAGQQAVDGSRIPTLAELIELVKAAAKPVRLNIETKLDPERPAEAPAPEEFAAAVITAVRAAGLAPRVTIQSFDWRPLLAVKRRAPEIKTACLTIETQKWNSVRGKDGTPSRWTAGLDIKQHGNSVPRLVKAAGCAAWAPFWRNLTPALVEEAHGLGLRVLPWTVNQTADMAAVIDMKVDGIITDYPDRAKALLAERGLAID